MHDDRRLIEGRLRRTLQRIEDAVWSAPVPVELGRWDAPGEPVPVDEGLTAPYDTAQVGDRWGPPWGTTWWRVRALVPQEHAGRPVDLRLDLGFDPLRTGFHVEGLVYRADGTAVKGLNPRNQWVRVADAATGGEQVELFVESASNPLLLGGGGFDFRPSPLGDPDTAGGEPMYRVVRAELAVFEQEVWELQQDLEVLGQLAAELPDSDPRQWQLLRAIDRAFDALDTSDIAGTAAAARALLAGVLADPARASAHRISAVGHAHIDSAWLWPVRETVRKVARTSSNVLALMDDHPELVYAMSSAQQFAWLKEHRPEVWRGVLERVREGRFVPVGGMWVESDTNMPGGEALARQLNHGKRFFLDEFGIETREVWLPDSFGYTAALPQLVALSASRWFLTQKISWNTTNRFPHHSFRWEGLDGTRIFTHFPPADTYGSEVSGAEVAHAARNFSDKGDATRSLLPFGWGDGGGGPTREMLARAKRLRDLDGSARIEVERPDTFFEQAEADYPDAPVWVGELYLEMHRGTYTSQAKTKQGNRRSEHLLREAELWASTATVRTGAAYPADALDRIWKVVLLQQFHDILPGSSIGWVHREAVAAYAAVATELAAIIEAAQAALAGEGDAEVVFNASPHARAGVAGLGAGPRAASGAVEVVAGADGWVLSNGLVRAVVDARGLLTSVVDTATGREALAPGAAGNLLQLHPDTPVDFDAWDVDAYYRRTWTDLTDAESVEAVEGGVRVVRRFGHVDHHPGADPDPRRGEGRRGHRGRLARAGEDPQGRVRPRRHDGTVDRRGAVRPRPPADPYQHLVGRREVRDLCAPVGPRGRARVRRGRGQRLDLRPRRHPPRPRGRRHDHAGPALAAARAAEPRSGGRPRRAPPEVCRRPRRRPRRRHPGGIPHQPAAAGGPRFGCGRRAARHRRRRCGCWLGCRRGGRRVLGGGRGGQAGRRRVGRRGGPAVRVAGCPGLGARAGRVRALRGGGRRPARAPAADGRCRGRRRRGRRAAAAVPGADPALRPRAVITVTGRRRRAGGSATRSDHSDRSASPGGWLGDAQ